MRIQLNRHELLFCDLFGTARRKNAMQFNHDRQVSKQNPYDMDIDGFRGEFAVAKYLNVMVDTSLNEKKNPVDLIWNGKTIDVKATRHKNAHILVTEYHKHHPCDLYVQTYIEDDAVTIVGWIDNRTLFKEAEIRTEGQVSYWLKDDKLFPIEMLGV